MTQQEELSRAAGQAAGAAASAAGAAASHALAAAATNAAKPGWWSSEFKATCLGILVAGGLAALHVLAIVPSPVMPAAVALTAGLAVASYSLSRGNVKAAALNGAAAIVTSLVPTQTTTIEAVRAGTAAVLGVTTTAPTGRFAP